MARILYFASLVDQLGRGAEDVELPDEVGDVRGLLAWLRARGGSWEKYVREDALRVTVNRKFAEPATRISDADEIALVSARLA
jgi:sulfur-carrier protein